MKTLATEMFTAPTGAAVLSYATDGFYHVVTLATPYAPPDVHRLTVIDNARHAWKTVRDELLAAGYAKLTNA